MKKLTLKEYAAKERLSIFQVVKLLKAGRLESETVQEEGKDKIYILSQGEESKEKQEENSTAVVVPHKQLYEKIADLSEEVMILRKELEALKEKVI